MYLKRLYLRNCPLYCTVYTGTRYEGRSINKFQNSAILLVFQI